MSPAAQTRATTWFNRAALILIAFWLVQGARACVAIIDKTIQNPIEASNAETDQ